MHSIASIREACFRSSATSLSPWIEASQPSQPNLLLGSHSLLSCSDLIEREGPRIGLHLNKAKSLLYIPAEADQSVNPLPSAIPIVREGFSLLGCPVGPPDFCEASFQTRIDKIKLSLNLLHTLEDSQAQTTLLRSCLALPKVVSVLWASPRESATP